MCCLTTTKNCSTCW